MTTPNIRALVSLVAALTLTAALGACAHAPPPSPAVAALEASPVLAVRFDNEAPVHVDVYLVGARREWQLGRVAPGARATLRIPVAALEETAGFARLAAIADAPRTVQAARDPRAALTVAQPASAIATQRWTFSQRQLSAPLLLGARSDGRGGR